MLDAFDDTGADATVYQTRIGNGRPSTTSRRPAAPVSGFDRSPTPTLGAQP